MKATPQTEQTPMNNTIRTILLAFLLLPLSILSTRAATINTAPTFDEKTVTPAAKPGPKTTPVSWLPGETQEQKDARMAWWREAKFGMFVHWGLYAIPADGEWHMRMNKKSYAEYSKYAAEFNPVKFNADEWLALAHDAGMKYFEITTKHHDGFAMFKSKASPYNIVDATPFKRDVLKELAEACPRHDIRFGVYYSFLADWGHPGGQAGEPHWDPKFQDGDTRAYIRDIAIPQMKELCSNYGPIWAVYFDADGAKDITPEESQQVIEILKTQPKAIVNPRLRGVKGDNTVAENTLGFDAGGGDWELSCTVNPSWWGYTRQKARPIEMLLPWIVTAWSRGGNVLLNVGPDREGIIPEDSVERLRQIGAWMKINGESIYGSLAGPFKWVPWGTATRKGDTIYLQVFEWPKDGVLRVPLANKAIKAWLLSDPEKKDLKITGSAGRILVHVPEQAPDKVVSVVAIKVEGDPVSTYPSLALKKLVTASSNQESAKGINDGTSSAIWRNTATTGSFEIDLGKPETFSVMRAAMGAHDAVKSFNLEFKEGDSWKPILQGKSLHGHTNGDMNNFTFPPVTARFIRFSFANEPKAPQIQEFELYPEL